MPKLPERFLGFEDVVAKAAGRRAQSGFRASGDQGILGFRVLGFFGGFGV